MKRYFTLIMLLVVSITTVSAHQSLLSEQRKVMTDVRHLHGNANTKVDRSLESYTIDVWVNLTENTVSLDLHNIGYSTMNSASELKNINLDLNPWVESLSNSDTHTIVDLTENGIYPLSEFILEENFKRRLDATSLGALPKYPSFVTPYIDVMRVFERYSSTTGEALYDIAAVLTTRQGDKIVLRTGDAETATDAELRNNENASVFSQKASAIALDKQKFYDLEIRINSSTRLNPTMGTPLCIDLGKIDERSMYVYSNPRTGIQYIYDRENKIAFSHLVDDLDGDWILDEYGIRDWVESLTTKSIALATIANSYKIIGL